MKTLPAQVVAAIDRPHVRAVPLVTISLTQPSALTIRVSDRPHWHDGVFYEPLLLREPSSTQGNVDPATWAFTTGDCTLVLNNARPIFAAERFSDLVFHPLTNPSGHIFEFAQCQFHVVFLNDGQTNETTESANPRVLRFSGRLETPQGITPTTMELRISDIILALNHRLELLIAGLQDLPLLHEDDVGKAANLIWGAAKEVPTLRATPGGRAILLENLDDAPLPNGRLRISGCKGFSPGGGQLVIGTEVLSFAGVICKEDEGEIGAVSAIEGSWRITMSATGPFNGVPNVGGGAGMVPATPTSLAMGDLLTRGHWFKDFSAGDSFSPSFHTRILIYRDLTEIPGTTLNLFVGAFNPSSPVGSPYYRTGGYIQGTLPTPTDHSTYTDVTFEVVRYVDPVTVEEILSWNILTNPPEVAEVLGTITFNGVGQASGTPVASVAIGSAKTFGVRVKVPASVSDLPSVSEPPESPADETGNDANVQAQTLFLFSAEVTLT